MVSCFYKSHVQHINKTTYDYKHVFFFPIKLQNWFCLFEELLQNLCLISEQEAQREEGSSQAAAAEDLWTVG